MIVNVSKTNYPCGDIDPDGMIYPFLTLPTYLFTSDLNTYQLRVCIISSMREWVWLIGVAGPKSHDSYT